MTYETYAECARQHFGGTLPGPQRHRGCGGWAGPAARITMNEGTCRSPKSAGSDSRSGTTATSTRSRRPRRGHRPGRVRTSARRCRSATCNAVDLLRRLDERTPRHPDRQTPRTTPGGYYPVDRTAGPHRRDTDPEVHPHSMAPRSTAPMVKMQSAGEDRLRATSAPRQRLRGLRLPRLRRNPAQFCVGRAFRWCASGDPRTRSTGAMNPRTSRCAGG